MKEVRMPRKLEKPVPTSGGIPVTDAVIAEAAAEAEDGYDVAALRRRGGRPPIGSAAGEVVPVRLDPGLKAALVHRAELDHTSSSEVIRQALRAWLEVA
ncbi:ribbon-helix-helix protein, CopG family [Nocardia sp. NPDC055321]